MNILYLCHRIPYPPNKGDKIRSFNEIRYLSKEHAVYLACLVDDSADLSHLPSLEKYVKAVDYATINPRWQKMKTIPYLLTSKPLTVPYFYSAKLQNAVDARLEQETFDVIFCFSSPMAEYIFKSRHSGTQKLSRAKLVMDFVDVDSDKWRMYAGFSGFPMAGIYRREWRCLQRYDAAVGDGFDQSIFISENEVELFRSICPDSHTVRVPNGVDIDYFATVQNMRLDRSDKEPQILFMGAMDYYPNEEAVVYFAKEVMPLVWRLLPGAKFVIVGSKPSRRVCQLMVSSGVTVTGAVPDVRPYLAKADLFVAPFHIARGMQNKILEAMAAGVPVIARPEAVQGFDGMDVPLVVQSSTDGFAGSVLEMLTDDEKRAALASEAARFVRALFTWEGNMAVLQQVLPTN